MILTRTGDFLTVSCPAKVNLFLEIHGKRPDGYHEIETVMQAITLYDDIVLHPRPEPGILFRCSDRELPCGEENLACRAAHLLQREVGLPTGLSITLDKRIPHGAGLGGGSSDAAGVLAGLDRIFRLGLPTGRLAELAAQLGSDVPFFIYGGTALCTGRGERVTPVSAAFVGHYVVCSPSSRLPTADVYRNLGRLGLTTGKRTASFIVDFLARGDGAGVRANLFNRLGEVAVSLAPETARARQLLADATSAPVLVAGSGSSVFALLASPAEADEVARNVRARNIGRVFVASSEPSGPQ